MSKREEWRKARVGIENDRRIRFTDEKKSKCKELYEKGVSINEIARVLSVNKRTIQFFLFPERLERNKELRKIRGGSKIYYDREYNRETMRKYRQHLVDLKRVERKLENEKS